jgi:hypothetical protein
MISWEQIVELLDRVPPGMWAAVTVTTTVATAVTWLTARRRMRRAGERTANPGLVTGSDRAKDTEVPRGVRTSPQVG